MLPSLLGYVETFKKSCIIIDECTVENNVQKLHESLRIFLRLLSKISHQIQKEEIFFFVPDCFGLGHKFKRNVPKTSFLEVLLDTETPVWITFLQTPKFVITLLYL